jgi:hypothetical protein
LHPDLPQSNDDDRGEVKTSKIEITQNDIPDWLQEEGEL